MPMQKYVRDKYMPIGIHLGPQETVRKAIFFPSSGEHYISLMSIVKNILHNTAQNTF